MSNPTLDEDTPIIPGEFAPKATRLRESDVQMISVERLKPPEPERTPLFYKLKAALLEIRPDFSCDWNTTSEALLSGILAIERGKSQGIGHYPMKDLPSVQAGLAARQQAERDDKVLGAIEGLAQIMRGFEGRLNKLENGK